MIGPENNNNSNNPILVNNNNEFIGKYAVVIFVALAEGTLSLSDVSINFLYKDNYHMSPAEVSFISGLIIIPWVLKPLFGILSDSVPIFGERRKSYIMIFSFISALNWLILAFYVRDKVLGLIILFNIQFCSSFCSVVGEAMLVEISQQKIKKYNMTDEQQQNEASFNVSLFFGIRSLGVLSTAYLGGVLLEVMDKYTIFAITSIFPTLLFFSCFFMTDPINVEDLTEREKNKRLNQMQLFFKFIKKPQIYQPLIFIILFACTPSSSSSMFFFYTNKLGFDPTFIGTLKLIQAGGSLFGIFVYNKFLKNIEFKKQFITTAFIYTAFSLSQLLLITRKNVEMGIPDKAFCLGDSILLTVLSEINIMPILVKAVRLCPRNIEATMYASVMSTNNLGSILSQQFGGLLTYLLGITENNFDNLWILVLITSTSTVLPLTAISLIDQKDKKKLSETDLTDSSKSLDDEQNKEINNESSTLIEGDPNTSIDHKIYGSIDDKQSQNINVEIPPVLQAINIQKKQNE